MQHTEILTRGLSLAACLFALAACDQTPESFDLDDADLSAEEDEALADDALAAEYNARFEGASNEEEWSEEPWSEELAAPEGEATTVGSVSCSQDNDCRTSCHCGNGDTCEPNQGVGPLPPAGYCDIAPVRSCSSSQDCRVGCLCGGGQCQAGGNGPLGAACHLPPPDSYESDNSWSAWSGYAGAQLHSFHYDGDTDWAAVYIAQPGMVRFKTRSLRNRADTYMRVYAFVNGAKGALLGSNDNIGGPWYWAESKSSRVDLDVPGDSAYLIEITDRSPGSVYTDSPAFPEYTLELSYL